MNKPILRLLLSLMFSLGLGCFVERSIFGNPFALNDDVRNQVYWMARIFDPTLFPQDFIADYFTQPLLVSPILHGIYSFFSLGVNPIVLTQFLPFALVILATLFLFKFAERYQDASYAFWTCFSFNCSIWIFKNLSGGLSRAFFYPLFFLLLWSLYTAQWRYVALTLWLSTLIYPPAFFLGLVLLLIEMWVHRHQEAERSNRIKCFFWSLGGSLMLVAGRLYMFPHEEKFGALTTHFKAEGMRFFYKGGRIVLFPFNHEPLDLSFPFNWLGEVVERIPNLYILIPTLIFAVLLFLYNRFLKVRLGDLMIPALVWRVMISSCLLYAAAWMVLFYLYVPERYLQYTLPLIPTFMFGGLIYQLHRHFPQWNRQWNRSLSAACLVIGLLGTGFVWRPDLLKPKEKELELYAYLHTLPVDAMIAAPPSVASNIPLYSFRSVLISNEAYIAFHQKYFTEMRMRLKDWLKAFYSDQSAPMTMLIQKYDVDYIVVQTFDYEKNRLESLPQRYYYAFCGKFFDTLSKPFPDQYFLSRIPDSCATFQNEQFKVFKAEDLLQPRCQK